MKDLQTRIQQMLNEKKNHNRAVALITALSLLMMFIVPYVGVMPGAAETGDNESSTSEPATVSVNDSDYNVDDTGKFTSAATNYPTGADDFSDNVNGATVTINGSEVNTNPYTYDAQYATSVPISVELNYSYDAGAFNSGGEAYNLINGNPYIYYNISGATNPTDLIHLDKNDFGNAVYDETDEYRAYSGTSISGYYSISQTGLILIRFTQTYIDYLNEHKNGFQGKITFKGSVSRANNADGDQSFTINNGGAGIQVNLQFNNDELSMSKNGIIGSDGTNPYIDWTITVNNPSGHIDMTNYSISDVISKSGTAINWTGITPNISVEKEDEGDTASVTYNGDGTFTVDGHPKTITITYRQPAPEGTYDNHAEVDDSTPTKLKEVDVQKTVSNSMTINKSATPDYQLPDGAVGDSVRWGIEVYHNAGNNLTDAVVTDSAFSEGSNFKYYDVNGQELDSSLFSLDTSSNTITFANSGVPSYVKIVYDKPLDNPGAASGNSVVTESNTASISKPGITDSPSSTGTATYKKSFSVAKDSDGFNSDTNNVKWRLTVLATPISGDFDYSKESLDGYKITDPAFANISDLSSIGFNAFYRDAWNDNNMGTSVGEGNNTSNITFTRDTSDTTNQTIIVHVGTQNSDRPVNKLQLYYSVPMSDSTFQNMTATEAIAAYQNGSEVTATNTASAVSPNGKMDSGDVEGTNTFHVTVSASKNCTEVTGGDWTVIGLGDKNDRILSWSLEISKDNGLAGASVTDTLQASVSGVNHYISTSQIGEIAVYGKSTVNGDWVLIENGETTYYTVTDTSGDEITVDSTGFKVNFADAIGAETSPYKAFHYAKIVYQSTAETKDVENGTTVVFSNDYGFGNVTGSKDGLTFTRKDPTTDMEYIKYYLNKTWSDSQNVYGSRPETLTVTIYRTTDTQHNDNSNWEQVGEPITLTMKSTGNYEQKLLGDNFPKWKDVNGSAVPYYYKLVETVPENYTADQNNLVLEAKWDGYYQLTNTLDTSNLTNTFGKAAADSSGNTISTIDYSSLTPVTLTVDGVEGQYYVFRWLLAFSMGDSRTEMIDYTDTLPNGAIYLDSSFSDYTPQIQSNTLNWGSQTSLPAVDNWGEGGWDNDQHTEDRDGTITVVNSSGQPMQYWRTNQITANSNGTLNIHVQQNVKKVLYYTAIPVDDLQTSLKRGKLINTVTHDSTTKTGELTITNLPEPTLIQKTGLSNDQNPGIIVYGVEFNAGEKMLSNGDHVDLSDVMKLDTSSTKGKDDLTLSLDSIAVYPYNADGTVDRTNPLNPGDLSNQYMATPSFNQVDTKDCTTISMTDSNGHKKWIISGWQPGDTVTITIVGSGEGYSGSADIRYYTVDYDGACNNENSNVGGKPQVGMTFDSNSNASYSFTIPESARTIVVDDWDYESIKVSSVTATATTYTPASLSLSVPDQQHLYIEYKYRVKGGVYGDSIKFNNSIAFSDANGEGESSVDGLELYISSSSASSQATTYPKLYKVDVGNTAMNTLSATFLVAKYIDGQWVYASSIQNATLSGTDTVRRRTFTFPASPYTGYLEADDKPPDAESLVLAEDDDESTENNDETLHMFALEDGALYKFVEIVAPSSNYLQPSFNSGGTFAQNKSFVYYYSYGDYSGAIPADATGRVEMVSTGGTVNIKNSQSITVSAVKTFSGETIPDSASVTFKLYWSSDKKGTHLYEIAGNDTNNLLQTYTAERTVTYSKTNGISGTAEWSNLPSGRNGYPVYYFVKEESYTIPATGNNRTTYYYDSASGKYKDNGGNIGNYTPVYTKNGANITGTQIEVDNTEGIIVKKLWQNQRGKAITPPTEPGGSSPMSISFKLYGYTDSTTKIELDTSALTLTSTNGYYVKLPDTIPEKADTTVMHELSDFIRFEIEEAISDEQRDALDELGYSDPIINNKVVDGVGTFEIINQCDTSGGASAQVCKVWSDGASAHSSGSVTAVLIQSTSELTPTQIKAQEGQTQTYAHGGEILLLTKDGTTTITDVKSFTISGTATASLTIGTLTITGAAVGSSDLTVVKTDDSEADYTVTVIESEVTLSSTNNWSASWENLPKTYMEGGVEKSYYYYAAEKTVPGGYTSSYGFENGATTITNTKETVDLYIEKHWITNDTGYQSQVLSFTLQQSSDSGSTWSNVTAETPTPTKNDTTKVWSYVYTGLDKYASNGSTQYVYRIVENTQISGFETSYSNNSGVTGGNSSTPIVVTNTELTSLAVRKEWSDGADKHGSDEITVVLHRSTDPSNAPKKDLIDDSGGGDTPTKNAFPYGYGDGATSLNGLPQQINSGDKLTITFNYTGEGTPNFNGGIFDTNDWNKSPKTYNGTISNGTATVELTFTDSYTNPQIQLWWVDGYSEMDPNDSNKRSENDKTEYAPVSITSIIYTPNPKTLNLSIDNSTIAVNDTATLTPKWSDNTDPQNVTYEFSSDNSTWSSSSSIVSVSGNTVTGSNAGTVYIRAKAQDNGTYKYSDGITLTVKSGESSNDDKKVIDGTLEINMNEDVTITDFDHEKKVDKIKIYFEKTTIYHQLITRWVVKYSWGTQDGGNNYTDAANKDYLEISINSENVQSLIFRLGGKQDENDLKITKIKIYYENSEGIVQNAPHPPRLTSPSQLTTTSTAEPSSSPLTAQHVYRAGKLTRAEEIIEGNEEVETISQAVSVLLKPKVVLLAAAASEWYSDNDGGEQKSITIASTDSWQWTDSLPMYDASGHKYYYWVEETAITDNSTLTAFDVAYKFDDGSDDTTYCIDAELHGNGEITIRNTPKESQAGVLPESGSTGTRIYYITGAMLLLLAAAGYWAYSIKRRRWYDE